MAHYRTQLVYEDAEEAFTERSKSLLTKAPNPRKWWSTEKTAVFGASSSLPPLVDRGGKLVLPADVKTSSAHFNAEKCRDSFQQLHSYDPSSVLWSVAFRSTVLSLILDLDPYNGNDPDEIFPLAYKQVARELALKLFVIFRHLVKGG